MVHYFDSAGGKFGVVVVNDEDTAPRAVVHRTIVCAACTCSTYVRRAATFFFTARTSRDWCARHDHKSYLGFLL